MKTIRIFSIFLARLFLSLIFLIEGIGKFFNWHETEKNLMEALCDWQTHLGFFSESAQECLIAIVPWSSVLLMFGTVFELLGGLMLLFGYRERLGVTMLILSIIPATFLFHSFWFTDGLARELQMTMFFKNLAILGGLILVALHGAQSKEDGSTEM